MSIAVFLSNTDANNQDALTYAIGLAKRFDATLQVSVPLPDPAQAMLYLASEPSITLGTAAIGQVEDLQGALIKDIRVLCDTACKDAGLAASHYTFEHLTGPPDIFASQMATLSDAAVFPRLAGRGEGPLSSAFSYTMMEAGLPVMLPPSGPPGDGPLIVAWDGSPQATRAVLMHERFIRASGPVLIAQCEADRHGGVGNRAGEIGRLESWLADRGVRASRAALDQPVGAALLSLASETHAAGIVMGAYGHSRAGEFLFGGVSRTLLRADNGPALALAH